MQSILNGPSMCVTLLSWPTTALQRLSQQVQLLLVRANVGQNKTGVCKSCQAVSVSI